MSASATSPTTAPSRQHCHAGAGQRRADQHRRRRRRHRAGRGTRRARPDQQHASTSGIVTNHGEIECGGRHQHDCKARRAATSPTTAPSRWGRRGCHAGAGHRLLTNTGVAGEGTVLVEARGELELTNSDDRSRAATSPTTARSSGAAAPTRLWNWRPATSPTTAPSRWSARLPDGGDFAGSPTLVLDHDDRHTRGDRAWCWSRPTPSCS